jgi:SAM-dependent methyltransferase
VALFRAGASPFQTALAMVGAKAGQNVLVLGAGDAQLAAEIALVTGLNGRTAIVVKDAAARTAADARAAEAGALLEIDIAPAPALVSPETTYDIVLLHDALGTANDAAIVQQSHALLRPGGRLVAIEGASREPRGWQLFRARIAGRSPADVRALLDAAGFRATRVLAEAHGASYVEGVKKGN